MLIEKLVLLIMAAIVFVPAVGGLIYYYAKGDKMDIYTQCFDCKHFGKDCMDMVGDEPACDCYEPKESEVKNDVDG